MWSWKMQIAALDVESLSWMFVGMPKLEDFFQLQGAQLSISGSHFWSN